MKFSKKTNCVLFTLLILLNIVIRLPLAHMFGTDSFFIYTLASSISTHGFAKWVIHPLSLLGVYPMSYSSMYPFLLSGTSMCVNLSIEYVVWLLGLMLAIFGLLAIYLVAKEIDNNDLFSFLVAFIFSTSPVFFFYTNWTATTRGTFMSLLPLLIYLLIKFHRTYKYLILISVFFLLLMTVHRLFYLLPLILIAYIVCLFLTRYDDNFVSNISKPNLYRVVFVFILIFSLLCVQNVSITKNYNAGAIFEIIDESSTTQAIAFSFSLLNLLINFTGKFGLNLLFGFTGFLYLLNSKHLTFNKIFFILCVIFLVTTLPYRYYTSLFYLPFISVFIGYSIALSFSAIRQINKKFSYLFIIIIFISTISFSGYMNAHWKQMPTNSAMSDETYYTALFVKEQINGTIITNEGGIGQQINAFSGKPVLPFGIQQWFSPGQLIYGFEDKNNIHAKPLPINDMLPPPDTWYTFDGVSNVKVDYQIIMYNDINEGTVKNNLLKYSISNVLLHKPLGNVFISYGRRNSKFIPSMVENNGKFYDSGSESIWYI